MTLLETDRLLLRPLRIEDAASIFEYACDSEITKYVAFEPHKSIEDSIAFIENSLANTSKDPLDQNFAIAFKEAPDIVIGTVSLKENNHPYEGVMGYVLARKYWRQGIMYEACSKLMKIAFKERGMKRVFSTCTKENTASRSLLKKLGMRYEGCLRANSYRKGRFWDLEYYAILDDEFKKFSESDKSLQIVFETDPSPVDLDILLNGICAYAKKEKGLDPIEPFAFFIKDSVGRTLGGCGGITYYGCLYVDLLWVDPQLRGQGWGTKLMTKAEAHGRQMQCTMATVTTMDWEAKDLYIKLGYAQEFVREGYTKDSLHYFMKKGL